MTGRNEGIHNTGTIHARNIAAGRNAHAGDNLTEPLDLQRQEIKRLLEEVRRGIAEHAGSLDRAAEVRDSTEAVAEELAKEKPNRTTVTGILSGIGSSVASVASLSTAVTALLEAAQGFL
jgi:hypothetical protein